MIFIYKIAKVYNLWVVLLAVSRRTDKVPLNVSC